MCVRACFVHMLCVCVYLSVCVCVPHISDIHIYICAMRTCTHMHSVAPKGMRATEYSHTYMTLRTCKQLLRVLTNAHARANTHTHTQSVRKVYMTLRPMVCVCMCACVHVCVCCVHVCVSPLAIDLKSFRPNIHIFLLALEWAFALFCFVMYHHVYTFLDEIR